MSILVTGGAGFIGSHFIELLLDRTDESIVCVDNFNDDYAPALKRDNIRGFASSARVSLVERSFCDFPAMCRLLDQQAVRAIVHLGARAGVRRSVDEPRLYQQANVEGTLSLLEATRSHPVERFLLVSSSTVYGDDAPIPFREDGPLGTPMSPYGVTKRAAELFGTTYHRLYGTPVVCVRPFSVYGPRLRPDLALSVFTRAVLRGEPLPLYGDGTIRRDFTHVSDICSGLLSALTVEKAVGGVFNLGNSHPVEVRELIHLIEDAAGMRANILHLAQRSGDMPVTYADLSRAERTLGYRPQVPLGEGVPEFVSWYQAAQSRRTTGD